MEWYEKLKFARKVAGLSLRDVKAAVGISDAYLCELEKGRIKEPSYFKIRKLLMFYNLGHEDMEK